MFASGLERARTYTRRERKEVYDWIEKKTLELMEQESCDAHMAWRLAVETCLLDNRFITVSKKARVLPDSCENRSQNQAVTTACNKLIQECKLETIWMFPWLTPVCDGEQCCGAATGLSCLRLLRTLLTHMHEHSG